MRKSDAERTLKTLGIPKADRRYRDAFAALTKGMPAWKVAAAYKMDPILVHRLGGPRPEST